MKKLLLVLMVGSLACSPFASGGFDESFDEILYSDTSETLFSTSRESGDEGPCALPCRHEGDINGDGIFCEVKFECGGCDKGGKCHLVHP